jgi:DUF1365 family protein
VTAPSSSSADVSLDTGVGRASGLRSGIYEGRVVHHRHTPVDHRFTYRMALVLLDLSEVAATP